MKLVQKTKTHKIYQRRDQRYAVKTSEGQAVNGEDKLAVLQELSLIKKPEPKAAEPEPVAQEGEVEAESEADSQE